MQINTTRAFQPVTLNLTFETQAELDCFVTLTAFPNTVTDAVQKHTNKNVGQLVTILSNIYNKLTKEG